MRLPRSSYSEAIARGLMQHLGSDQQYSREGKMYSVLLVETQNRPRQKVDWQRGKPSVTRFQVIAKEAGFTRMEFVPVTGRTHQLRVHAADPRGLGIPILGDRLYSCCAIASRL